jgi:hypothetical protein
MLWKGGPECPPKIPCIEGLGPSMRCPWEVEEPLRGGAWWEEVRTLGA